MKTNERWLGAGGGGWAWGQKETTKESLGNIWRFIYIDSTDSFTHMSVDQDLNCRFYIRAVHCLAIMPQWSWFLKILTRLADHPLQYVHEPFAMRCSYTKEKSNTHSQTKTEMRKRESIYKVQAVQTPGCPGLSLGSGKPCWAPNKQVLVCSCGHFEGFSSKEVLLFELNLELKSLYSSIIERFLEKQISTPCQHTDWCREHEIYLNSPFPVSGWIC